MTDITVDLVRALVAGQFPHWKDLPVRPVARQGWDNRTFRLGASLAVRLPSVEGYVAAVEEERCLAVHAGVLPRGRRRGRPARHGREADRVVQKRALVRVLDDPVAG
ncbi:hypothetical protein [Streptosporangium saharense]|uniref:hypothetical protein n=1 Tax=Streptosporangium saharense TaxID=1706840 RepID=UPI00332A387E